MNRFCSFLLRGCRDNNDTIIVMNEIPKDMTEKSVGGNNTMSSSFKERLTSLKVKVKLFQKDETTGFRDQRISTSECIGVCQSATNDDTSKFDDALLTRFHQLHYHETSREHRSIADLLHAHKNIPDNEKKILNHFIDEFKVEQYRYFLVEKLIMTGCIPDFNEKNSGIYFRDLWEKLRKDGYVIHPRVIERMMIMTRIFSICLGLECLFNIPTGLFFGQPFELSQLREIKPFLFPPIEVMQFVAGLFVDQLVNPMEKEVLAVIKAIHSASTLARRFRQLDDDNREDKMGSPADMAQQTTVMFGQDKNLVNGSVMGKKKNDFNYVAFNKSVSATCDEIHKAMDQSTSRPSSLQIRKILLDLKARTISSHQYDKLRPGDPEPTIIKGTPLKRSSAVIVDAEGVYIHCALLEKGDGKDPMEAYISEMWYSHTLAERTIHGVTEPGHPHVFKVLTSKPNKDKKLVINNVLYMNKTTKTILCNGDDESMEDNERRGKEMEIFFTDMDTDSLRDQLVRLEMPDDEETIFKYHPYRINMRENDWLAGKRGLNTRQEIVNTFNYPGDLVNQKNDGKRRFDEAFRVGENFEQEYGQFSNHMRKRLRITRLPVFSVPDVTKGISSVLGYNLSVNRLDNLGGEPSPKRPVDVAPSHAEIEVEHNPLEHDVQPAAPVPVAPVAPVAPAIPVNNSYWSSKSKLNAPLPEFTVQVAVDGKITQPFTSAQRHTMDLFGST